MILALEHKCCLGPFPLSLALNPLATNRPKGGGGGASERRPCTLGMPVWFFVFFLSYKDYPEPLEVLLHLPESLCQELPMGPVVMDCLEAQGRSHRGGKS